MRAATGGRTAYGQGVWSTSGFSVGRLQTLAELQRSF